MADQAYKHANKKYDKCHKKDYIFCFYNSYIFLNKEKTLKRSTISSSDSKKNIGYIIQVVANKIFETSII